MTWTEHRIGRFLARVTFARKCLVIVPNCSWPGSECDLLVVTQDLRVIDVEIKTSRADLRADLRKDKWFHAWDWKVDGPFKGGGVEVRRPRDWPRCVWKHYYCMPRDIWRPELADELPTASGILLMFEHGHDKTLMIRSERRAKPCRDAQRLAADDAVDIARLAGLRMWDALEKLERRAA